jgi:glycosyltransferase involved in cell wall biosynthesis
VADARRRLRVLYLVDDVGAHGGAERFARALAEHVPRERVAASVCSTRKVDPSVARELAAAGVSHLGLGRDAAWQLHRFAPLVALIRHERFDVLHAHKFGSNVWGAMLGRATRVPIVLAHEHNWSYVGGHGRRLIDGRLIAPLVTRFLTVSEASRARMVALEGIAPEKLLVLPTAYVPSRGTSGDIRSELGIDPRAKLIVVAAGLRAEKALEVLFEAHARLTPGAHLVVAGEGPCREQLERLSEVLGTQGAVHLLGWREDVDGILACADAGVICSDWEGMPLFALECMAAGVPLVASAVGGTPELVRDGESALLVAPRDAAALADALTRVLEDGELAGRLAGAARARVAGLRIEQVATCFADLYEQLVSDAARR